VNIARQALSQHTIKLQHKICNAYIQKDAEAFRKASDDFLQIMLDMDELLETREEFLLGRDLEMAKAWGTTPAEKAIFEWNARRILTLWGETPEIDDYACKEWSGMMSGYYYKRWKWYSDEVEKALKAGTKFDETKFQRELRAWMLEWSDSKETYPSKPKGDSVAVAKKLWEKYGDAFKPDSLSLTTSKPATCSEAMAKSPAFLANDGYARNTKRFWAASVAQNPWWQVDLEKPTKVGRVVVVGYYGDKRVYGFTVETSLDGKKWDMVADKRENREPSTAKGITCRFEPRKVRYIKVTLTSNSANTGRHLVEVMAYEQ